MGSFNTIQYDIDLKQLIIADIPYNRFNTIQYDIDLKQSNRYCKCCYSFNTIQYDIDLKPQIARSNPIHREYRYIKWII